MANMQRQNRFTIFQKFALHDIFSPQITLLEYLTCTQLYIAIIINNRLKYYLQDMPEATFLVLDNSAYSINGDYQPTRWMSQLEAAILIIQNNLGQHHENAIGLALSAGAQVQIACSLSNDLDKVRSSLFGVKQHGSIKLSIALQNVVLALKNGRNQSLAQRIMCFIGSTITDNIEQLKLICKKLKKNGIALDLIAFGDLSESQRAILQEMHIHVLKQKNSGLHFVQPMCSLEDKVCNILQKESVNEADDPQLAMALQLSLQEEERRLAAQANNPVNNVMVAEQQELEQRALQLATNPQNGANNQQEKKEQ